MVGGCSKLKCDANFFDDDGYPENGHFWMLEVVWGDKANREIKQVTNGNFFDPGLVGSQDVQYTCNA